MLAHRALILLVALVLLLFAVPVATFMPLKSDVLGSSLVSVLFALTLAAAAIAISSGWKAVAAALLLALPAAILQSFETLMPYDSRRIVEYCFALAFFGFTITVMLRATLTSERVTFETICSGLSVYLLLGVFWAIAYSLLDIAEPGASFYTAIGSEETEEPMRFGTHQASIYPLYFSFVTMTTLGYGDIVPKSPAARMLAAAQAVLGQFYIAVLLARLVAMHVTDSRHDRHAGRARGP